MRSPLSIAKTSIMPLIGLCGFIVEHGHWQPVPESRYSPFRSFLVLSPLSVVSSICFTGSNHFPGLIKSSSFLVPFYIFLFPIHILLFIISYFSFQISFWFQIILFGFPIPFFGIFMIYRMFFFHWYPPKKNGKLRVR